MNLAELTAERNRLRKLPDHCSTCGKPWKREKYKRCDKCRAKSDRYNQKKSSFRLFDKRIGLLELKLERQAGEIARLTAKIANVRRAAWTDGARAAKKLIDAPTPEVLETISIQEASQICHAYENER